MPARAEMNGQQWETVTFSPTSAKPALASAKTGSASAKPSILTPRNNRPAPTITKSGMTASALEDETELLKHQTVGAELKRAIMQARQAKSLTQKGLALQLGVDQKTVQEYEAGKAIPNNALIAKMERTMGVKLPRAPKK